MFKLSRSVGTPIPPFDYIPATSAEAITLGEALVLSSGLLTKCSGANTPEFIAVAAATGDGATPIPVMRINETIELETTLAASGTSLDIGDKVTIHTDGAQVTATTTSGVFELSRIDGGGASGATVAGFFRPAPPAEDEEEE